MLKSRYKHIDGHYESVTDGYLQMVVMLEDGEKKIILAEQFEQIDNTYYYIMSVRYSFFPEPVPAPAAKTETTVAPSAKKARLPRMELPKFSGNIQDWPAFDAMFNSLVNSDADLTDTDKLFYLLSCIQGEAKQLVGHIRTTDEGYAVARDILQRRYDNPQIGRASCRERV